MRILSSLNHPPGIWLNFLLIVFSGIHNSNWQYSSRRAHGEVTNQLKNECSGAGLRLGLKLMAVATSIQVGLYLAFSILISWELVAVTITFTIMAYFVVRPIIAQAKIHGEQLLVANRNISFYAIEYIRGLKLLEATGAMGTPKKDISEHSDALNKVSFKSELNTTRIYFLVQALPVVLLTGIIDISIELMEIPTSLIHDFGYNYD